MEKQKVCLNIGCGKTYLKSTKKEKWINLEVRKDIKADIHHDLDKFPYPFKDNTFDFILASHILEHVDDIFKVLKEIKRILKQDGTLKVETPYFSNAGAFGLTHKRCFYVNSFNVYPDIKLKKVRLKFQRFKSTAKYRGKIQNFLVSIINSIVNLNPRIYERFFCHMLVCQAIQYELQLLKDKESYIT